MLSTTDWLWAELQYQNSCWIYLALWYQVECEKGCGSPALFRSSRTTGIFWCLGLCSLQNVEFSAVEIRNYHLCGFIIALYEKKQVARFKYAFVVYRSCLDIQKQMAVYHSRVNSLTFWGFWCVLKVIFFWRLSQRSNNNFNQYYLVLFDVCILRDKYEKEWEHSKITKWELCWRANDFKISL